MNRREFFRLPPRAPSSNAGVTRSVLAPLHVEAGLEPHDVPLDTVTARHLLRRTGMGYRHPEGVALLGKTADEAVDAIVGTALAVRPPQPFSWIDEPPPGRDASQQQRDTFQQQNMLWIGQLLDQWVHRMRDYGLRERLTLFWSNHFVTQLQVYRNAPVAYRYLSMLRTHALGNFRTFVRAVGLDVSMLLYLNGAGSEAQEPNENYARELMELFTMGQYDARGNQNYTQEDVEQIARALTGWVVRPYEAVFVPARHDDGQKTIFGRTGRWGYDDVVDLLFSERGEAIASFVAGKLYEELVYAVPDPEVVAGLAQVFLQHDFEIAPVVRTLLESAHFFDPQVQGARIKAPIELLVAMQQEMEPTPSARAMSLFARISQALLEQPLLNPPNVAGWPGHHTWVTTNTLPNRWFASDFLLFGSDQFGVAPVDLVPLARALSHPAWDAGDRHVSPFYLPVALAEHFLPIPLDVMGIESPDNDLSGDLTTYPIPDEVLDGPRYVLDLATIFLGELPWFEWNLDDEATALPVLLNYVRYLTQLPEYQLT